MGPLGAAPAGAEMLQEVLRRKFTEALAQQKLQEDMRQANMQHQIQQSQLNQGQQRIGLEGERLSQDDKHFNVSSGQADRRIKLDEGEQPYKIENLRASTNELLRKPTSEQQNRDFVTGRDKANYGYDLGKIRLQNQGDMDVAGVRANAAAAGGQQQQNDVQDTIDLIDQISQDASLPNATGPVDSRGLGMVTDTVGTTRVNSLYNQLVGKMSLAQAGKLKGQGQISDKERALLRDAATALNTHLGDADFKKELAKIRQQFERMKVGSPTGIAPAGKSSFRVVGEVK